MFSQKVIITNPSGLHARPASMLAQFTKNFSDQILLKYDIIEADPKSIISLLSAGIKSGTEITVEVTGDTAQETGEKLMEFLKTLKG